MTEQDLERREGDHWPPMLGVCGSSGAGKTTLLEAVIPILVERGLAVAVLKHDAHGADVDRPGKDSDRLFRAGANVVLDAPDQQLWRRHEPVEDARAAALELGRSHDLVLVEGHSRTAVDKVWLTAEGEAEPPADVTGLVAVLQRIEDRPRRLLEILLPWLELRWRRRPLLGGLLLGGDSRRMGRPKQLVEVAGLTLAERTAAALAPVVDEVVALGSGPLPPALDHLPRVPDAPGAGGPLAGILAALRWAPDAAWLVAACDHPLIDAGATRWLASQRRPGVWAVLPRLDDGSPQPLLACYEPQAGPLLELALRQGRWGPRHLDRHPRAAGPVPPDELAHAWRDADTPEALHRP